MPENEFQNLDAGTLRVLDAAMNRAAEGIRVVEDYARLILNDPHLTGRLKSLRHNLVSVTSPFSGINRIASRDTEHDVGTGISNNSEFERKSTTGVVQANLARVQQSFRTIEEYSKLIRPDVARAIEPLRYESYVLEKALLTTILSLSNLKSTKLFVLIDGREDLSAFSNLVVSLIDAGVDMFQLRDKELSARQILERGKVLNEICRPRNVYWIMNDRADLAVAAGADGVHLGQEDLSVAAARRLIGPAKLIGVSTHTIEQARAAVVDGANYIGVGPIFHSRTKEFKKFVGVELAAQVAREIALPAFAIGGITLENVTDLLKSGIHRVAVKGSILDATNPKHYAEMLKAKLLAVDF